MHDILLRESANPSCQALRAIDLISEHTEVENWLAGVTKVRQKLSSHSPACESLPAHSLFAHPNR